jgi:hypothetical protein
MVPIHPMVLEKKFVLHISHRVSMLNYVSLVQIGPVVLEELIKMQKANDRQTTSGSNSSHDPSEQIIF